MANIEGILPGANFCVDLSNTTIDQNCCAATFVAPMTTGTATAYEVQTVATVGQSALLFGPDSPAHEIVQAYFDVFPSGSLQVIPFLPTGAAATGSFAITGTATENGVVEVFINGEVYIVDVLTGDTAAGVVTDLAADIAADAVAPVSAVDGTTSVDLTAKVGGTFGNAIYIDASEGPDGITVTVNAMSGGAGTADYTLATSAVGEGCCADFFAFLDTDDTSMDLVETWMEGRWSCGIQNFTGGRYYNVIRENFTDTLTYLMGRTDRFGSTVTLCEADEVSDYQALAGAVAAMHNSRCDNPTSPYTGSQVSVIPNLVGVGCSSSCFGVDEEIALASYGATLLRNGNGGSKEILVSTGLGIQDDLGQIDTFARHPQAAYQIQDIVSLISDHVDTQYEDTVLVPNGTPTASVSNTVTPNQFNAELAAVLRPFEGRLVIDVDAILEGIETTIDARNPSRLVSCINFNLASALRAFDITLKPTLTLGA